MSPNERDIGPDQDVDLGTLNGKPFVLKIVPGTGIEWSGGLFIRATNSSIVTSEEHAAMRAARMYTAMEHDFAQETIAVIGELYRCTQGKDPLEHVNDLIQHLRLAPDTVRDMLTRLGIDADSPFRINGQHFAFVDGLLTSYNAG